jgi:hypothetical protein
VWGQGGEITQALYAHMNKKKILADQNEGDSIIKQIRTQALESNS